MIPEEALQEVLKRSKTWEKWRNENKDVPYEHRACLEFEREIVADNVILVVACREMKQLMADYKVKIAYENNQVAEFLEEVRRLSAENKRLLGLIEAMDMEAEKHG